MSRLKGEEAAGSAARAPARRPPMSVLSGALLLPACRLHLYTDSSMCHSHSHARHAGAQTNRPMHVTRNHSLHPAPSPLHSMLGVAAMLWRACGHPVQLAHSAAAKLAGSSATP